MTGKRDHRMEFRSKSSSEIEFCWTKLDRKSKKVSFLITQNTNGAEEKATGDTVEDLANDIADLQMKLDLISLNINA